MTARTVPAGLFLGNTAATPAVYAAALYRGAVESVLHAADGTRTWEHLVLADPRDPAGAALDETRGAAR